MNQSQNEQILMKSSHIILFYAILWLGNFLAGIKFLEISFFLYNPYNLFLWSFCYFTGLLFLIISFRFINKGFEYEKNRLIELEQALIINELNEYKNCCDDGRSNKKKNKKTS
jgi:hypothetical protein|tara:strand:- start:199 stop:537 length:339 start_codon:yes stop_codon:yes gene_type:complete